MTLRRAAAVLCLLSASQAKNSAFTMEPFGAYGPTVKLCLVFFFPCGLYLYVR